MHALLGYFEREAFEAPRVLGIDDRGREILTFLEGEAHAGNPVPLPDAVFVEDHLLSAARLLRRYHEVVTGFDPPREARWRLVGPPPHEIICHNDWSPWNALFRDRRVVAMLDWDLAGPGSRLWDVANAAYCWTPLISDASAFHDIEDRARRLRLFCDAYGLSDRSGLIDAIRSRLIFVGNWVQEQAASGDAGMARLVADNVPRSMFVDDVAYLDEHRRLLEKALA